MNDGLSQLDLFDGLPLGLQHADGEQRIHAPSYTPPPNSTQPNPVDRVSSSLTEAPFSFRLIARIYSALTGSTAFALALMIGGLFAIYIYFQVLATVATLATLPVWLVSIAVAFLGILLAVVVIAFFRLAIAYKRLRCNKPIHLKDIQQLEQHTRLRHDCSLTKQKWHQARTALEKYVRDYPVKQSATNSRMLGNVSFNAIFFEEETKQLSRVQRQLVDPHQIGDASKWLDIYANGFQAILDKKAEDRVGECAKYVGIKTAISPNSLVDSLIAIYWCFILLRDLCLIYNVRVHAYGTAAMLWRAFFTAYLAGKLDDWEDHIDNSMESLLDGLPEIGRIAAGKIAAKAGTGLANYLMVKRLGKRAIALLRPLEVERG